MQKLILVLSLILPCSYFGQGSFPPPAGQAGSTAIHKDSSVFVGWATNCITNRGPQDIAVTNSPLITLGDDYNATGQSGEFGVVSLGDGGTATLTFDSPIYNGSGWDFAIFENGFSDQFLELAFVEVSSDGVNFYRFPATSETQDTLQTGGFGNTDATNIDNLAGKYRAQYGTPFDLDEMNGIAGLDVNNITHVKIIDVIGTIDENYASLDQYGAKINDPYPTDFASGGFDLDAVGVIHQDISAAKSELSNSFSVYHRLGANQIEVSSEHGTLGRVFIYSLDGKIVLDEFYSSNYSSINVENLNAGIYIIRTSYGTKQFVKL